MARRCEVSCADIFREIVSVRQYVTLFFYRRMHPDSTFPEPIRPYADFQKRSQQV